MTVVSVVWDATDTTVVSVVWDATDTTVVSTVRLWTKQDGRVRRVKYKGHDRRVNNIHH